MFTRPQVLLQIVSHRDYEYASSLIVARLPDFGNVGADKVLVLTPGPGRVNGSPFWLERDTVAVIMLMPNKFSEDKAKCCSIGWIPSQKVSRETHAQHAA